MPAAADAAGLSKAEMLKQAKAALGDKKPEGVEHEVAGLTGETVVVEQAALPEKAVLVVKGNTDCVIELRDASVIKVLVQGCRNCTVTLNAGSKIVTETMEVWECSNVEIQSAIKLATLQVDISADVRLRLPGTAELGQVVSAGVEQLSLGFAAAPEHDVVLTADKLQAVVPELAAGDQTTQFITRLVDGAVLTEEVIRLANEFPTTAREKAKHDRDIQARDEALNRMAAEVLAGGALSPEDEAAMKEKLAKASSAHQAELGAQTGADARAEHQRVLGNEQFGLKEYQQAAAHYTQAIALKDDIPSIFANRSMCWLKLGHGDKALADADRCVALDPKYTKAHFRRGVALLGLERYVEACQAFRTTLDLDPKNAQAKSSMMLAEKKLSMARRG